MRKFNLVNRITKNAIEQLITLIIYMDMALLRPRKRWAILTAAIFRIATILSNEFPSCQRQEQHV
jgi:hypothetical protein